MKLRTLALSLYGHPKEVSVPFSFETRALCNFVQRHARLLKIETIGFNQIVIHDDPLAPPEILPKVVPEKTLKVPFKFDHARYSKESCAIERQSYFIEVLKCGLEQANQVYKIPLTALLRRIDEFIDGGCQNRWTHVSRSFRGRGVLAKLECELSMHEFKLTLELRGKGIPPTRLNVLSTMPDETCFFYRFKDVELRGDDLVITKRIGTGAELARFNLSTDAACAASSS